MFEMTALLAVKSSVSIVEAAPVIPVASPQDPAPAPSDIHASPAVPGDVIKYSLFSTLLADNVPSAKSAKSPS